MSLPVTFDIPFPVEPVGVSHFASQSPTNFSNWVSQWLINAGNLFISRRLACVLFKAEYMVQKLIRSWSKTISISVFLSIFTILLCCNCFASEAPKPKVQESSVLNKVDGYMTGYYKHPQPNKLPWFINTVISHKEFFNLDQGVGSIIAAFITEVAKNNPEKIYLWMQQIKAVADNEHKLIYQAIWDSNTQQSKRYLKELAKSDNKQVSNVAKQVMKKPPEDILNKKIDGLVLDQLWASYEASGNDKYLIRILEVANEDPKKYEFKLRDKELVTIDVLNIAAATWSLNSKRNQDKEIDNKIKKIIASKPELDYTKKVMENSDKSR